MKRVWTTAAIVAMCLAPLGADVTITQTITLEGPMAAALGGQEPKIVMKIKGKKARAEADMMGNTVISITDLDAKQVIILNSADKTAQILPIAGPGPKPDAAAPKIPDVDVQFKALGSKRTISGASCDDHSFSFSMDMAQFGAGQQMPPEAAEMMKGVKIVANGVTCLARDGKGVADFSAFQKAAVEGGMLNAALGGLMGGGKPGAASGGGMDKLMSAVSSAPGLPYVTEITMTFEGTGPMVDMMKQMGGMKIVQKTTDVSTDPLSDDLFKVPADYTVTEKK